MIITATPSGLGQLGDAIELELLRDNEQSQAAACGLPAARYVIYAGACVIGSLPALPRGVRLIRPGRTGHNGSFHAPGMDALELAEVAGDNMGAMRCAYRALIRARDAAVRHHHEALALMPAYTRNLRYPGG